MKRLNLALIVTTFTLSILSIYWHHQAYLLNRNIKKANTQQQALLTINQHYISQKSHLNSGLEIWRQAQEVFKMQPIKKIKFLSL
jgi:cell division protein FtsL